MPTTISMCGAQVLPKQHNPPKRAVKLRLPTGAQQALARELNKVGGSFRRAFLDESQFGTTSGPDRRVRCAVIAFPERRR